ncbi:hypothetical protein EMIT0P4_20200 [Pseudomonas sp. IT-P4]
MTRPELRFKLRLPFSITPFYLSHEWIP